MYENAEVMIRLSSSEVQQVLGIWLDNEAQQALEFIKEKVADKTMPKSGKRSAGNKMAPGNLVRNNCSGGRVGGVGKESQKGLKVTHGQMPINRSRDGAEGDQPCFIIESLPPSIMAAECSFDSLKMGINRT
jgi:hypothetical protein